MISLKNYFYYQEKQKKNLFPNAKEACLSPNEICEQIEKKI